MSDEVSNFLRSVEQLKDRRDEEDEARSRELEEKILQERRERQARRAERARSISPQKSSPANTPPPSSHRSHLSRDADGLKLTSSPVPDLSASPKSRALPPVDTMDISSSYSASPTKENESPFDLDSKRSSATITSPPTSGVPTRAPTLSWQRRPTSQASGGSRSRPLSVVAAENAAARSSTPPAEPASPEHAVSRDQIAQALLSKDPSWFRQTADRGQNSAAYRRNQVEDEDRLDMSSMSAQLPGMSRAGSTEPERDVPTALSGSPAFPGKLGSPLPLTSAQKLDPPINMGDSSIDAIASPLSTGRTSPTRPISPTKGMGGFVQSAMMKRSDSVKRWSVTSPQGLQRAGSVASNRNSVDYKERTASPQPEATSRPGSMLRESSSRPTSSHARESPPLSIDTGTTEKAVVEKSADPEKTPPTSPSRTMDQRRWSPNKTSSWLDAALNKPESPKPKPTPPASSQPAWMVELNKAKAQKTGNTSVDLGRPGTVTKKHEVKTGGLLRSSAPGTTVKPAGLGRVNAFSSPVAANDKPAALNYRSSITKSSAEKVEVDAEDTENVASFGSPPTIKSKPETPPKKDFRAGLKPRQPPPADDKGQANELQNVFGNLRRTKTQNYVAPDELKDNILRGKAALNLTGGPKPRERKDEFKEAILKKKEDFKKAQQEGKGVTRAPGAPSEKPIPEGLAKKLEMSRSSTISSKRDSATSQATSDSPLRTPTLNRSSISSTTSKREPTRESVDLTRSTTVEAPEPVPLPSLHKETSAPGRLQGKVGASALADRFNPALAGLLARGPPGAGSGANKDSSGSSSGPVSAPTNTGTEPGSGPQLTHMTKNRARGPRRKAPSSVAKPVEQPEPVKSISSPEPLESSPVFERKSPVSVRSRSLPSPKPKLESRFEPTPEPKPEVITLVDSSKNTASDYKAPSGGVVSLVDSSKKREDKSVSTGTPISFGGSSHKRSPSRKIHEQVAAIAAKSQPTPKPAEEKAEEQPSSPRKLNMKRISKFLDESAPAPEADRTRSPSPVKRTLTEPTSPTKQTPSDKVDSDPIVSVRNGAAIFGGSAMTPKVEPRAEKRVPEPLRPRSPTKNAIQSPTPVASSGTKSPPPISSPMRSPNKYAQEVSSMLNDFFGDSRPKRSYNVDAAELLMNRPQAGPRIQTQKVQLFQVSADGKKVAVPGHYERVLFEREMYICPHTFTNGAGKKVSEVYFWAGDEVPESTVEDAHFFVNREARAMGGKLIKIRQGKETPEFIQALGGIVIVRRGSSNKYDSLAPNMLCGRRFLGQIVFDEVDFAPSSLCSGFPYLITQQGKCYLWKGKGSSVDELSCARLIGMDLALMGELLEVEDGSESAAFWSIFDGGAKPGSADHWRLKPSYDKYCGRLFCSDVADRKQIIELHPFSQIDLQPNKIYILDAFFEMYIIVGRQSQSQYAAFHNALDFAQEYAILAAGMEDRPFVPISTVVLEGIPRDLKSVFRKWRDDGSPTRTALPNPASPNLKRGRSLRIVPLTQALQALSE